eukprot:365881-Chlamydomonas_euryale.AAC.6
MGGSARGIGVSAPARASATVTVWQNVARTATRWQFGPNPCNMLFAGAAFRWASAAHEYSHTSPPRSLPPQPPTPWPRPVLPTPGRPRTENSVGPSSSDMLSTSGTCTLIANGNADARRRCRSSGASSRKSCFGGRPIGDRFRSDKGLQGRPNRKDVQRSIKDKTAMQRQQCMPVTSNKAARTRQDNTWCHCPKSAPGRPVTMPTSRIWALQFSTWGGGSGCSKMWHECVA